MLTWAPRSICRSRTPARLPASPFAGSSAAEDRLDRGSSCEISGRRNGADATTRGAPPARPTRPATGVGCWRGGRRWQRHQASRCRPGDGLRSRASARHPRIEEYQQEYQHGHRGQLTARNRFRGRGARPGAVRRTSADAARGRLARSAFFVGYPSGPAAGADSMRRRCYLAGMPSFDPIAMQHLDERTRREALLDATPCAPTTAPRTRGCTGDPERHGGTIVELASFRPKLATPEAWC